MSLGTKAACFCGTTQIDACASTHVPYSNNTYPADNGWEPSTSTGKSGQEICTLYLFKPPSEGHSSGNISCNLTICSSLYDIQILITILRHRFGIDYSIRKLINQVKVTLLCRYFAGKPAWTANAGIRTREEFRRLPFILLYSFSEEKTEYFLS